MDSIVALCKRRGFVYPSSDIYGGIANTWDFGHYGVLLKNNIRDLWWKQFVLLRDDMVGIEASIILHPKAWEASGHISSFVDAMVDCKSCKSRFRADHLIGSKLPGQNVEGLPLSKLTEIIKTNAIACPRCGSRNFTEARYFNLLLETQLGVLEENKSRVFLRGEIAQGIFLNFKNVVNTMRVKIPFGIAQQGKAFRNEITLGQFIHRTLEFDLMEFEYFIHGSEWEKTYEYWKQEMWKFAQSVGLDEAKIRWREHADSERSHYSKKTMDIEYKYPFGWAELFGLAYRTDYDIKKHSEFSGKDLQYVDPVEKTSYIPHVIEPSFGLSRLAGAVLFNAYREEMVNNKPRIYLDLQPCIAPIKAAIVPLQKDPVLTPLAHELYKTVKSLYTAEFDDAGNIGKMYRRQDEIGTPFCITIDYQSLDDKTVTVRERNTMKQKRISIDMVMSYLEDSIKAS